MDWKKARRLYERDGLNYTQIGQKLGCRRETVAAHAKREGWLDPARIQQETSAARREKIFEEFIRRDADAILANLTRKHEIAGRLLSLTEGHVERLEQGIKILFAQGDAIVAEDPIMSLRRLGLVLQNVEVVDRSIANLRDDGWRSARAGGEAASSADEEAVRAALAELEDDEPRGGREGAQGALPH